MIEIKIKLKNKRSKKSNHRHNRYDNLVSKLRRIFDHLIETWNIININTYETINEQEQRNRKQNKK